MIDLLAVESLVRWREKPLPRVLLASDIGVSENGSHELGTVASVAITSNRNLGVVAALAK